MPCDTNRGGVKPLMWVTRGMQILGWMDCTIREALLLRLARALLLQCLQVLDHCLLLSLWSPLGAVAYLETQVLIPYLSLLACDSSQIR